eukprot:GILJ01006092.1.p1 GENE.GILJ01006092.1~~GILJ01006092.1.p1  ORF type:complete len:209 (-),score=17.67 GILJ01006092.1:194-820(-)
MSKAINSKVSSPEQLVIDENDTSSVTSSTVSSPRSPSIGADRKEVRKRKRSVSIEGQTKVDGHLDGTPFGASGDCQCKGCVRVRKNRISARRSQQRKNEALAAIGPLKSRISELEKTNSALSQEVLRLETLLCMCTGQALMLDSANANNAQVGASLPNLAMPYMLNFNALMSRGLVGFPSMAPLSHSMSTMTQIPLVTAPSKTVNSNA